MNPIYVFKSLPESVRAVGLALLVYVLYLGVSFDPMAVTDWKAYVLAGVAGLVQAGCGAGLAQVKR